MELNTIVSIISTLGFPIVAVGAVGWYVKYISDKNRDQIDKIMEQHHTEIKDITTALNNNTLAITKLTDFMKEEKC